MKGNLSTILNSENKGTMSFFSLPIVDIEKIKYELSKETKFDASTDNAKFEVGRDNVLRVCVSE